jgi:putative CocE/NonD family hydrolase
MAPNIKNEFPHKVRTIENTWIPMPDGVRLAARIWLPVEAEEHPVPALLEYLPYRKNDGTAVRDALRHPYLAGHGYAMVRVDMRGSGDADGIMLDEYLPQELADGVEVIAWLAKQPWCSGKVGMFGKSWGGFNALQVAALRPPALKAIITLYSTDDRYSDDIHYIGGCQFGTDHLTWATTMLAYNARPTDPRFIGEQWRETWLDRLEQTPPYINTWLKHQRRDDFWKHGSVCQDYSAITCAVYAIGGWADGYTNAVPRLLSGLSCPRKGLIGPWSHQFPETAIPGPMVGFLQESLRWWDYWLKDAPTGIMDEPMFRVYMQDSAPPSTLHIERAGRWVAEEKWPSKHIQMAPYYLNAGGLSEMAAKETAMAIRGSLRCGADAGVYYSMGNEGDEAPDQRAEDGLSLSCDSEPLVEPLEIMGLPHLHLSFSSNKPQALVAVRLCDVAPGGESTLVTRGLLNLTHRNGHESPEPLVPDMRYTASVRLKMAAHAFKAGHRVRIALSPTYWPWAWPSPENVTLTVFCGWETALVLPVRPARASDAALAPFGAAETSMPLVIEQSRIPSRRRTVTYDAISGLITLSDAGDAGAFRIVESDIAHDEHTLEVYEVVEGKPLSARAHCERTIEIGRDGWRAKIFASSTLQSDLAHFYVTNHLEVRDGDASFFERAWSEAIPRDEM